MINNRLKLIIQIITKNQEYIKLEEVIKGKFRVSLRFFITMGAIVISLVAVYFFSVFSTKKYYENELRALRTSIEAQGLLLGRNILKLGEVDDEKMEYISSDVDAVASFFTGRVMIIDNSYRVIADSSKEWLNSYVIDSDVMSVMTGAVGTNSKTTENYIRYIIPVSDFGMVKSVIIIEASLFRQNKLRNDARRSNSVIAISVVTVCIVLALFLGYAGTKDLKYINKHIEEARDGYKHDQIPEKGFEELRAMTENYNKTIERLMQIDTSRQEFVSNVSHELKTPITSMKVLADSLVQNEAADLPMYKEFMTDIIAEIDRESQIITDLLTLVKTDKDTSQAEYKETDINEMLEIIIKRVSPIAQARGIDISYEKHRDVTACVDEVKLALAFSNIIENAVKYNVDNGWVKVSLNADHKNFHIKVSDSGVGIPDDCKDKVFERFYRVDKARSRDTGGTGLGLSITRNIIRMHGGSIKLYSESGAGTTFTIKVPIEREDNSVEETTTPKQLSRKKAVKIDEE